MEAEKPVGKLLQCWDSEYRDKQRNSKILWRIEIVAGLDGG